jgi:hypothetical protein
MCLYYSRAEADFNWLQGLIIGRRTIREAESKNRLHDNQWGSRPGHHALGAVMLKVMSYETARLTRTRLAPLTWTPNLATTE